MQREKMFDLFAVVIIASIGLLTAYVSFGILQSQAEAEIQRYSVSGAIAGALIASSLLASFYLQFRKSSDEVRKLKEENAAFQEKLIQSEEIKGLRKHNEELQKKLLKGAPRPRGFEIEVSERERVVLAIPDKWEPRGGILFDFTMPEELLEENDKFPARFNVTFIPITEDTLPMDDFYETYRLNTYEFADVYAHTCEQIFIGGELSGIKSLKIIAHQGVYITVETNNLTGKITREWQNLTAEEYKKFLDEAEEKDKADDKLIDEAGIPSNLNENQISSAPLPSNNDESDELDNQKNGVIVEDIISSTEAELYTVEGYIAEIRYMRVVCYHEDLENIYFFDFFDDLTDFAKSSEIFNQILGSIRFLN